jgi:hypothetical protein
LPPTFTIQARRVPAIASCRTPAPVLELSAAQVPLPLAVAIAPLSTFQTRTRLQRPFGRSPSTSNATRAPSIASDSTAPGTVFVLEDCDAPALPVTASTAMTQMNRPVLMPT